MAVHPAARRKIEEFRAVTVREAFIHERFELENKISRAAERMADAKDETERQRHKRTYQMLCGERNWL